MAEHYPIVCLPVLENSQKSLVSNGALQQAPSSTSVAITLSSSKPTNYTNAMQPIRLLVILLLICFFIELLHMEPVNADLEMIAFKLLKKAWKKKYKKKFKKILAIPIPIVLKKLEHHGKHQ